MKIILSFLVVFIALAQAEVDWSKVIPVRVAHPPKYPVSNVTRGGSLRIVGGVESIPHSRPYQVGLLLPLVQGTSFCGGSLVTPQTVLTAAHCVDKLIGPVEVILGAHNVQTNEPGQQRLQSSRIIIHPQWNDQLFQNDVALIILPRRITLNAEIQVIQLPERGSNAPYTNLEAVVSGWGLPSDSATSISPVLREVKVPIMANTQCNIRYSGSIINSHICAAGIGGRSSCNGDSGGPLVIDGVQVGIVSFGISLGCEVGWPSVYARLTSYSDWIHQNEV